MHTVEEIELRRQDRDGLVPEAEKVRAAHPKGRFWRTR